ncbi:MAG: FAD-dependent oxidoreductase [Alphaproteobacteria bacterium]
MIVIFGSGIIGLFIANNLLNEGLKVKIIDVKMSGSATEASVGMLAPLLEAKPYENELFNLMLNSKKIWDSYLENDILKRKTGLKENSSLLVAMNEDEEASIYKKKEFIKKIGFETLLCNSSKTLEIEPNLNSNVRCSLFLKNNNQVEPKLLKNFLLSEIKKKGGEILRCSEFKRVSFFNNNVSFLKKTIKAEKIIIACGVWSNELLKKSFNIEFPMRPIKGVSVLLNAKKKYFSNNIWFKNIYLAPRDGNKLAIGATEDEKSFETTVNVDEIFYLSKKLWEYLPEVEMLSLLNFFSGLRSTIIDGNPIIGSLKKNKNIICAFGHYRNGILLAPITAQIVCKLVLEKKINEKFLFFSPNRFNL